MTVRKISPAHLSVTDKNRLIDISRVQAAADVALI
jgi:hypothetical protein